MELKVAVRKVKTLKRALEEGRERLRTNDYASELRKVGAAPIWCYAVAFDGKRVKVERVGAGFSASRIT